MTIKEYQIQFAEFCKIDDFNLEERAKRVPAEKHFWVARFIEAKIERSNLNKQKKKLKEAVIEELVNDSPVAITKQTMDRIDNSPQLETINDKLKDIDFLIEYLELVVKTISFIAQDIKNIIEIKKLEETG